MQDLKPRFHDTSEMMSAVSDTHDATAPGATRAGAELRVARQRLGWALSDVAATLRIRLAYLEAIEDGRLGDLPGAAYAVGFLRSYSTFLGLDAAEVARRFRAESAEMDRAPELLFPAPVPDRGAPAGAVVLLGAVIALGAYAAWYQYSGEMPAAAVPPVPERLAPLADLPPPGAAPQEAAPVASVAAAEPTAAVPAVSTPPADSTRLVLRVKSDAWVQVREKQGPVLLARVLRGGESWPVPQGRKLLLTTGNAGGTELMLDGATLPSLGAAGAVRRDLALEPDALKAATRP